MFRHWFCFLNCCSSLCVPALVQESHPGGSLFQSGKDYYTYLNILLNTNVLILHCIFTKKRWWYISFQCHFKLLMWSLYLLILVSMTLWQSWQMQCFCNSLITLFFLSCMVARGCGLLLYDVLIICKDLQRKLWTSLKIHQQWALQRFALFF